MGRRSMRTGSFSTQAATASMVVMFATNDTMTTSDSYSGVLAEPDNRMELRNVSMLQAQKKPMPTWRRRIVFHTMRMLRRSRATDTGSPISYGAVEVTSA